jgi:hypothetical protein
MTVATLGSYFTRVGAENVMRISELLVHMWKFTIYSLELETDKDNWSLNCFRCLIIVVHVSFILHLNLSFLILLQWTLLRLALGKASGNKKNNLNFFIVLSVHTCEASTFLYCASVSFCLSYNFVIYTFWSLRSVLFWDFRHCRMVASYWHYGTNHWSHLQGSNSQAVPKRQ